MRTLKTLLTGCLTLALAHVALADEVHHDHDRKIDHLVARAALERGEIMPLEAVLAAVRPKLKDEVVGIKFEMHHDVWYYEFRTVDEGGHLHYIHANAKTAEIETVGSHP